MPGKNFVASAYVRPTLCNSGQPAYLILESIVRGDVRIQISSVLLPILLPTTFHLSCLRILCM